jgi:hypothetical protein
MKYKVVVSIAFALLISGCVAPQPKKLDPYLVNFNKDLLQDMGAEFRSAEAKEKTSTIRLYSAFNAARQSPKFLYSSKLAEAKGLLLEYKASESISSGTATVFSELAKYMSEPYTDQYLHEYVDYILVKISTRIE